MVAHMGHGELTAKGHQGTFWDDENVLNLVLGGGYAVAYNYQKSLKRTLKEVCIFHVNYVSIF